VSASWRRQRLAAAAAILLHGVLLSTARLAAQEPQTEAGARSAATQLVKQRGRGVDSLRVVADSATLYRDFVRCREVAAREVCALTDNRAVHMVLVRLVAPDTAAVEERTYEMHSRRCPGGAPFESPRIMVGSGGTWRMVYRGGRWVGDGLGRGWIC
jgi:hypothetical protein